MALILDDLLTKEDLKLTTHIFATDIDNNSLQRAKKAQFQAESLKNVKFGLLKRYFVEKTEGYELKSVIKDMVKFSKFDLFDNKLYTPPGSIFGNFDIVLCRNVLIYIVPDFQERIFDKLYRALNKGGYLILGEAEVPLEKYKNKFRIINRNCKMYQKI